MNGYFTPSSSKKSAKRTNAGEKSIDVPLERRLENLIVEMPFTASVPAADSLVHLLLQVSDFHWLSRSGMYNSHQTGKLEIYVIKD